MQEGGKLKNILRKYAYPSYAMLLKYYNQNYHTKFATGLPLIRTKSLHRASYIEQNIFHSATL